jgi:c-di-GMP-binding flagellar brake protein YcgR
LEIGSVLTLELQKEEGENVQTFTSKVVDQDGSRIFIDYPVNNTTGRTSIFFEGTPFTVTYKENDDIIYSFQTEVVDRKKLARLPVLVLHLPSSEYFMKIQRRNYLRIKTPLDVSIHSKRMEFSAFSTSTLDISGGGMAILIPKKLELKEDSLVDAWIVLPFKSLEYSYVHVTARVIRQINRHDGVHFASLEFVEIENSDRDKVIRYCFQKQLEQQKDILH